MKLDNIITKQNYLTPSRYISGRIVEYDIRSANISVLRNSDIISQEDYEYLASLPKILREKEIGLREKEDPTIYTSIQKGIKEAKKNLISFNQVETNQIIRIANDAVYINSNIDLEYRKFGEFIEFVPKSKYDVFCNLNNIIIFCKFDNNGNIHIDIKGIGDNIILHRDYMVYTIMSTIALLERSGIEDAIDYLSEICRNYVNRNLPVGYYREFNSTSMYKTIYQTINMYPYGLTNVMESDKFDLDINYNYSILRELWSILFEIYTIRKR